MSSWPSSLSTSTLLAVLETFSMKELISTASVTRARHTALKWRSASEGRARWCLQQGGFISSSSIKTFQTGLLLARIFSKKTFSNFKSPLTLCLLLILVNWTFLPGTETCYLAWRKNNNSVRKCKFQVWNRPFFSRTFDVLLFVSFDMRVKKLAERRTQKAERRTVITTN